MNQSNLYPWIRGILDLDADLDPQICTSNGFGSRLGWGSVSKFSVIFRMQKNQFLPFYVLLMKFKSFKIVKICLMIN
jgi:hypothetical protein